MPDGDDRILIYPGVGELTSCASIASPLIRLVDGFGKPSRGIAVDEKGRFSVYGARMRGSMQGIGRNKEESKKCVFP